MYKNDTNYFSDQRGLFMNRGNQINHKLQKVFDSLLGMFSVESKLSDDQMECMQFGICDYCPRKVREVPFFHY